ncbi:hypothetical protein, partial [Agathobaculum butyriciproducens]|uniref:hypothetical protein n=1 Tax=Agathobaculum butyriciproducens TaxID=1628085 RepID=UPI001D079427|nr:hypothetical protein [Agathobaculum butyriciproducens]
ISENVLRPRNLMFIDSDQDDIEWKGIYVLSTANKIVHSFEDYSHSAMNSGPYPGAILTKAGMGDFP